MEAKPLISGDTFRKLLAIGLAAVIWLSWSELRGLWTPESADAISYSGPASVTLTLYVLLYLVSLLALLLSLWKAQWLRAIANRGRRFAWPVMIALVVLLAWIHQFSPLRAELTGPWAQFLIALGLARIAGWLLSPEYEQPLGWREILLAMALFLFPGVVLEARIVMPSTGFAVLALAAWTVFLLILAGMLYGRREDKIRSWLLALRLRLGFWRFVLGGILLLSPLLYRYATGAGGYILYPNIRFTVFLMAWLTASFLLSPEPDRLIAPRSLVEALGGLVLSSAITQLLLLVVNDPFSLSWSEGNRFYDYSLIFGQDLYNYPGEIENPYDSPGRYVLWGVLFLWKGLPIWVHRFWNTVLLTLPSLLLAWLLTRKIRSAWRLAILLWIASFFILMAPLHPPFMLLLILVAAFAFHRSGIVRGSSLVAASLYAGLSRWTWVLAPGAWGALIDLLLYYPGRRGSWFARLLPTALMTALGAVPGLLLQAANLTQFSSGESLTSSQPLLWYRLLPNATLGPGVLWLMVITTGPLVAILIYQSVSKRWPLDVWQSLAAWGSLAGFLGAGLVISTKIGGGGDLHNLDMYIGTLMLVTTLMASRHSPGGDGKAQDVSARAVPAWVWAMLLFLLFQPLYFFTPFSPSAGYHKWLDLLSRSQSAMVLERIQAEVDQASSQGEVLFMDQRQLLTFGYVSRIPFVPQYEKKFMMDQAMAANQSYFLPYYEDLEKQRFKLIVTEILRANLKGEGVFSEENDAWVKWVSGPTLCYYEPIMTEKSVGVQLLVPRQAPKNCEKYLQQVQP